MTLLPLLVTVNSGWVICSMIQIELLSKTVDSSSDCASCGLAKTRFPPVTGVPALAELVLVVPPADEEAPDPQPASATRAQPTVRATIEIGLCLTSSSGEYRSDGYVAKGMTRGEGHDRVPGERHDRAEAVGQRFAQTFAQHCTDG